MIQNNKFTDEDKQKVVEFLNFLAKKSKLNDVSFEETINFFKLLAHMQQQILPKIDANIFEIKKIVEAASSNPVSE